MATELTIRARNVLRVELDRVGVSVGMSQAPDPRDVMKLDPKSFRSVPNCGKSTMDNISLWMLEQGYQWSPNLPWYPDKISADSVKPQMNEALQALLDAAKAAAVVCHRDGYKLEWVSFQQGNEPDEIEVGIRVSKDVMVSLVKAD